MLKSLIALTALAAAGSAQAATVLFAQNFDALPVGVPAASVPGFTISGSTVDVVATNTFSIDCAGGAGKCLDLAGTPGPGTITTGPINFLAGRDITISFDLSGNQRTQAQDTFTFGIVFLPANSGGVGLISGPPGFVGGGFLIALNGTPYVEVIDGDRGFLTYSGVFNANADGAFVMSFSGVGGSDARIGPILDNVLVTQAGGVIPEPATWAMLIAGFGLVGTAMRRRRTAVAA